MTKTFRFTKMHGIGNDYIYVDCLHQDLSGVEAPALSRAVADRHRGVGSDGLILITAPSAGATADVRMEMYNADGSRGEMCGNGIRCVAKYAVDHGLVNPPGAPARQTALRIETDRGVLNLVAFAGDDGKVDRVRVDMGPPILLPRDVPVKVSSDRCVRTPLEIAGRRFALTCVSMGNPHAVIFVDDAGEIDLAIFGPVIEHHPIFPNRTNVHFARAISRDEALMRTWERGSGITQACGTGACAVLVAGVLEDRLDEKANVHLSGGDLLIEWPEREGSSIFMTGPAVEIFTGEWVVGTM